MVAATRCVENVLIVVMPATGRAMLQMNFTNMVNVERCVGKAAQMNINAKDVVIIHLTVYVNVLW